MNVQGEIISRVIMTVVELTHYINEGNESITITKSDDTGYFMLKPLLPLLLKQEADKNVDEDRLLAKYGILVDTDNDGEKWITGEKAFELLDMLGLSKQFSELFGGVKREGLAPPLGSPLKKMKKTDLEVFNHDLGQVNSPLQMMVAKQGTDTNEKERLKLETFLQKLLFPEREVSFETVVEEVNRMYPDARLNLSIGVDEYGNTPLHWLASIGNLSLVKELVRHGADRMVGDAGGESAVVKAVKCVNNYDAGTFEELLDWLYPCLILKDSMGRSVLHHITITSGVSGCAAAAKYYLDILMGWIVKHGGILKGMDLQWVIGNMLNAVDVNGDTCLNIAARLGNVAVVEALLDYGADSMIGNRDGMRPVDFGVAQGKGNGKNDEVDVGALMEELKNVVSGVDEEYAHEVKEHKEKVEQMRQKLDTQRELLAGGRERLARCRQLEEEHGILQEQLHHLQQGIAEEEERFGRESVGYNVNDVEYDADEPFKVGEELPPREVLVSRVRAYRKNATELETVLSGVVGVQEELEGKLRRVLALCLKVEEEKVDGMLDGLLEAIVNEEGGVDTAEMESFLNRNS